MERLLNSLGESCGLHIPWDCSQNLVIIIIITLQIIKGLFTHKYSYLCH